MGPFVDTGLASGARVLRTAPGRALGPGHNSIITGPDGTTDFMVYHAWGPDMKARRLCIDPIDWTPQGPRARGPSTTPQSIHVA